MTRRRRTRVVEEKVWNEPKFRVAMVRREDGVAILELGDGRMFPAKVPDHVHVSKGCSVTIVHGGFDNEMIPKEARVETAI